MEIYHFDRPEKRNMKIGQFNADDGHIGHKQHFTTFLLIVQVLIWISLSEFIQTITHN